MRKKQNIFITVTLLLFGLLISGCEDFLELEPKNQIAESAAFTTESGLEKSRLGMYTKLIDDDGWYIFNFPLLADVMGGNSKYAPNAKTSRFSSEAAYNFNATSTNSDLWADAYIAIYMANKIISNIDGVSDEEVSAARKNQIKGEAYFMRALAHFDLVREYAQPFLLNDAGVAPGANGNGGHLGVPLITEDVEDDKPPRATVNEVYTQIIADLQQAETLMSDDFDSPFYGTKPAAQALLARVFLYKGDNTNAETYATRVINNTNFSLISAGSFVASWSQESTSESIFSVPVYQAHPNYPSDGESIPDLYNADGTYGDLCVSNDIFSLHEAGDARLGLYYVDGDGVTRMAKFPVLESSIPVIRLSEMYLTRAEARVSGNPAGALTDINTLRSNRGLAALGSVSLNNILLERRLELAFEGHQLFDLTRTGRSLDREDNPVIERKDIAYPSYLFALPIPEYELNGNPNIIQNEGYKN